MCRGLPFDRAVTPAKSEQVFSALEQEFPPAMNAARKAIEASRSQGREVRVAGILTKI
jgi:hypothetical protein